MPANAKGFYVVLSMVRGTTRKALAEELPLSDKTITELTQRIERGTTVHNT